MPPLLCSDGTPTVPQAHSSGILLDAKIGKDLSLTDNEEHARERELPDLPEHVPFTEFEVQAMVQSIKLRSAPADEVFFFSNCTPPFSTLFLIQLSSNGTYFPRV